MRPAGHVDTIKVQLGQRVLYLYLFTGDTTVLVDTGISSTPSNEVQAYLAQLGIKWENISLAINTHCDVDHFGGNADLKRLSPRTLLLAHELDRELIEDPEVTMRQRYLQFEVKHSIALPDHVKADLRRMMGRPAPLDILVKGGEQIRIDDSTRLHVLHTPGHSQGHISLYDANRKALYIGDAVLWKYVPDKDGKPALPPPIFIPTNIWKRLDNS